MFKVVYDELDGRYYPCQVDEDGNINRIFAGATMKRIYQKLAKGIRKKVGLGDEIQYYVVGYLPHKNEGNEGGWYDKPEDKVLRQTVKAENKAEAKEAMTDRNENARRVKAFKEKKLADKYYDKLAKECKAKNNMLKARAEAKKKAEQANR